MYSSRPIKNPFPGKESGAISIASGIFISLFLLTQPFPLPAAGFGYVTDQIDVHVRKGTSIGHRIVATVSSGTHLAVIAEDQNTGYSKVELDNGASGWLLSRFIMSKPTARSEIAKVTGELTKLRTENKALRERLGEIESDRDSAPNENKTFAEQKERRIKEFKEINHAATDAITIKQQKDDLQEQVINLMRAMETLKREHQSLEGSDAQYWFFIGAAVLVFGIALGLIIPRLSWRRKSSWDTF